MINTDLGYVYFVREPNSGAVKIGYTKDVDSRMAALQTANPNRLECLLVMRGTMNDESALHSVFAERRISGEWFDVSGGSTNRASSQAHIMSAIEDGLSFQAAIERAKTTIVQSALERCGGNVTLAADQLKISRTTLSGMIGRYGLRTTDATEER